MQRHLIVPLHYVLRCSVILQDSSRYGGWMQSAMHVNFTKVGTKPQLHGFIDQLPPKNVGIVHHAVS